MPASNYLVLLDHRAKRPRPTSFALAWVEDYPALLSNTLTTPAPPITQSYKDITALTGLAMSTKRKLPEL